MKIQYGSRPVHCPKGKIYYIGDIHNEADKLMELLDQIEPLLTPDDHIVFLGDLFDRGPNAALVVEVLVDLAKKYPTQVFFVRGNHDWMLQNYLVTGSQGWFQYLISTLMSFKLHWNLPDFEPETVAKALADKGFREITSRLIPYYESEETIGTHAPFDKTTCLMNGVDDYAEYYATNGGGGIGFNYFLDRIEHELMWEFTDESFDIPWIDKFRVCGHQPGRHKHPRIFKERAFIDTGAGKGPRPITCLAFPGKQYWQSSS